MLCPFLASAIIPQPDTNPTPALVLAWNVPTDPIVAGVYFYWGYGTNTPTNQVDCHLTGGINLMTLTPATNYCFATTTYTLAGAESAMSPFLLFTNYSYDPTNVTLYFSTNGVQFATVENPTDPLGFFCLSNGVLVPLNAPQQKYLGDNVRRKVALVETIKVFYRRTP